MKFFQKPICVEYMPKLFSFSGVVVIIHVFMLNFASAQIVIDDNFQHLIPSSEISFVKGNENFGLSPIINQEFKPLGRAYQSWGTDNGVYWFKIPIKWQQKKFEPIVFNVDYPRINKMEVYCVKNNQLELIAEKNYLENGNGFFDFKITEDLKAEVYYLKVNFNKEAFFPFSIYSYQNYVLANKFKFLEMGLYYGLAFVILFMNFMYYLSFKDKSYLYYVFFQLFLSSAFMTFDGFYTIVSTNEYWLKYFDVFSHFMVMVTGVIFADQFLNTKVYFPLMRKISKYAFTLLGGLYLGYLITQNMTLYAIADALVLIVLGGYWICGIIAFKWQASALYSSIGYSSLLLFSYSYLGVIGFGLDNFIFDISYVRIGGVLEMLLLSYAIVYRMRTIRIENKLVKQELSTYQATKNALEATLEAKYVNPLDGFSDREIEIVKLISKGLTNKEIGVELELSINTIKYHAKHIYAKLGIKSRKEIYSKELL